MSGSFRSSDAKWLWGSHPLRQAMMPHGVYRTRMKSSVSVVTSWLFTWSRAAGYTRNALASGGSTRNNRPWRLSSWSRLNRSTSLCTASRRSLKDN